MAMAVAQSSSTISTFSGLPSATSPTSFSARSNLSFHRRPFVVACHSSLQSPPPSNNGGCCGGSSSSSSGSGSCSSHGKAAPSLANVGKEFEQMVASATMDEYEKHYVGKPMEGSISRDVFEEVMQTYPEESASESEEKFLDVNALLDEARRMSQGSFIFSDDSEDMVLI